VICGRQEQDRFAASIAADLSAVRAAFDSPWSSGQVEGQINRLKFLKRQMYGRAAFALLRQRMVASLSFLPDAHQPCSTKSAHEPN
jgi:transposase